MALPQSVQKQSDFADSVEKSILEGGAEQPAAEQAVTDTVTGTAPQTVDVQQPPVDETEKLRARYNSLRGKYDSEVPRLSQENKEMRMRLDALAEENRAMRDAYIKAQQEKVFLTDKDVDTYGEDMVDLVRRGAREESAKYAADAAAIRDQLQRMQDELATAKADAQRASDEALQQQITMTCPRWREFDTSEGFNDWLDEEDPLLGITRREAFGRAVRSGNGRQVGAFFNTYIQTLTPPPNQLAKQVSPQHRAAAPLPQGRKIWTTAEIEQFYRDARRGLISREDADKIEREINEAVASGNYKS